MFRLWVVATVIWVGIIGNIGYHEWRAVPQLTDELYLLPDATSDFHTVNFFDQFDPGTQKDHSIIKYPHDLTLMIPNFVPSAVAEAKKEEFERDYVYVNEGKRYDVVTTYLEAALLPPLAVLAFGAAMAWALTGFMRN
jgi:hypothetical protein